MPPALFSNPTYPSLTTAGSEEEISTSYTSGSAWSLGRRAWTPWTPWARKTFDSTSCALSPRSSTNTALLHAVYVASDQDGSSAWSSSAPAAEIPSILTQSHPLMNVMPSSNSPLVRRADTLAATTSVYAVPAAAFGSSYLVAGLSVSIILGVAAASIGVALYVKRLRSDRRAASMPAMIYNTRRHTVAGRHRHGVRHHGSRSPRTQQSILRHAVPSAQGQRGVCWWDEPPEIMITMPSPVVDATASVVLPPVAPLPEPIPPRRYSDGAALRPIVEEAEPVAIPPPCHPRPHVNIMPNQSELDVAEILAGMRCSDTQGTLPFPANHEDPTRSRPRPTSQSTVSRSRQNSEASTATNASEPTSFWETSSSASSAASSLKSRPSVESITVLDSEAEMTSDGEVLRVVEARRVPARSISVKHAARRGEAENIPPCPPLRISKAEATLRPLQPAFVAGRGAYVMVSCPSTETVRTEGSSCPSVNLDDFPTPPAPRRPLAPVLSGNLVRRF